MLRFSVVLWVAAWSRTVPSCACTSFITICIARARPFSTTLGHRVTVWKSGIAPAIAHPSSTVWLSRTLALALPLCLPRKTQVIVSSTKPRSPSHNRSPMKIADVVAQGVGNIWTLQTGGLCDLDWPPSYAAPAYAPALLSYLILSRDLVVLC